MTLAELTALMSKAPAGARRPLCSLKGERIALLAPHLAISDPWR